MPKVTILELTRTHAWIEVEFPDGHIVEFRTDWEVGNSEYERMMRACRGGSHIGVYIGHTLPDGETKVFGESFGV